MFVIFYEVFVNKYITREHEKVCYYFRITIIRVTILQVFLFSYSFTNYVKKCFKYFIFTAYFVTALCIEKIY